MPSDPFAAISNQPIEFFIGLLLLYPLGLLLERIIEAVGSQVDKGSIGVPSGISAESWEKYTRKVDGPGEWLGHIERILFYISILIAMPEIIVGLLAFKVASKWQVWKTIINVPEKLTDVDEIEYFSARRF
jgi:hypothetical protein